ncbi:MAG: helix-turn-helix domain-containing protein [bacterium]|nr:helix-turn-helix domain-containing protein [bacterium]
MKKRVKDEDIEQSEGEEKNVTGHKDKAFHARLVMARNLRRMSQEDLAKAAETSQNQISRYELGLILPRADVLGKLADVLETSTDWLLGRIEFDKFEEMPQFQFFNEREIEMIVALRNNDFKKALGLIE